MPQQCVSVPIVIYTATLADVVNTTAKRLP